MDSLEVFEPGRIDVVVDGGGLDLHALREAVLFNVLDRSEGSSMDTRMTFADEARINWTSISVVEDAMTIRVEVETAVLSPIF